MTEETLFELVLNTPAADRPVLLDSECAENPALRARVEALVAAFEELERIPWQGIRPAAIITGEATGPTTNESSPGEETEPPASTETWEISALAAGANDRPTEGAGAVLAGRYKLVEEIGEGGMGTRLDGPADGAGEAARRRQGHQGRHGQPGRAGPVRGRAPGAGADGPPEHRPGARRRHAPTVGPPLLRHGAGQGDADHQVLRRAAG